MSPEEAINKLYNMECLESVQLNTHLGSSTVTRVPGGWLIATYPSDVKTFVPYNEEFKY